jgi:hypothetical protein
VNSRMGGTAVSWYLSQDLWGPESDVAERSNLIYNASLSIEKT